jgi:hypothetical protein
VLCAQKTVQAENELVEKLQEDFNMFHEIRDRSIASPVDGLAVPEEHILRKTERNLKSLRFEFDPPKDAKKIKGSIGRYSVFCLLLVRAVINMGVATYTCASDFGSIKGELAVLTRTVMVLEALITSSFFLQWICKLILLKYTTYNTSLEMGMAVVSTATVIRSAAEFSVMKFLPSMDQITIFFGSSLKQYHSLFTAYFFNTKPWVANILVGILAVSYTALKIFGIFVFYVKVQTLKFLIGQDLEWCER